MNTDWIKDFLLSHPNFPIEGVNFVTFNNLLADPVAFSKLTSSFVQIMNNTGANCIAAIDSRGFIFGSPLAYESKTKLCIIRKPGNTPNPISTEAKQMEYAKVALEMATGSLNSNDKVIIVDDIIATGSTLELAIELIEKQGASVAAITALANLAYIPKTFDLKNYNVQPLLTLNSIEELKEA